MSIMGRRDYAKMAAKAGGFFWLPCPSCGTEFGGHEWYSVNGHFSDIPSETYTPSRGGSCDGICLDCTSTGVGCRAHAAIGSYHTGCEFVSVPGYQPQPRVERYSISYLPEDHDAYDMFVVYVERRSKDSWAVTRGGCYCYSRDGKWDYESVPSERTEEWLAAHRWGVLSDAFEAARSAPFFLRVNGYTLDGILSNDSSVE